MARVFASVMAAGAGAMFGLNSACQATVVEAKKKDKRFEVFDHTFKPFKLGEVINLTSETAMFRFLLPSMDDEFNLTPCSTLQGLFKSGASQIEHVQRFYTPITQNGSKGYFDIIVKKQKKGRMTEHLFSMNVGESLGFRVISYKLTYKPNHFKHIGMIGAGTGITPLLQVIRANTEGKDDTTKTTLLYANPNEHRILLKGLLDQLSTESEGKFKPVYIVDNVVGTEKWDGLVGMIDAAVIKKTMPPPADENLILVCGSDKLLNSLCGVPWQTLKQWSGGNALQPACSTSNNIAELGGVLAGLGYSTEQVYRF